MAAGQSVPSWDFPRSPLTVGSSIQEEDDEGEDYGGVSMRFSSVDHAHTARLDGRTWNSPLAGNGEDWEPEEPSTPIDHTVRRTSSGLARELAGHAAGGSLSPDSRSTPPFSSSESITLPTAPSVEISVEGASEDLSGATTRSRRGSLPDSPTLRPKVRGAAVRAGPGSGDGSSIGIQSASVSDKRRRHAHRRHGSMDQGGGPGVHATRHRSRRKDSGAGADSGHLSEDHTVIRKSRTDPVGIPDGGARGKRKNSSLRRTETQRASAQRSSGALLSSSLPTDAIPMPAVHDNFSSVGDPNDSIASSPNSSRASTPPNNRLKSSRRLNSDAEQSREGLSTGRRRSSSASSPSRLQDEPRDSTQSLRPLTSSGRSNLKTLLSSKSKKKDLARREEEERWRQEAAAERVAKHEKKALLHKIEAQFAESEKARQKRLAEAAIRDMHQNDEDGGAKDPSLGKSAGEDWWGDMTAELQQQAEGGPGPNADDPDDWWDKMTTELAAEEAPVGQDKNEIVGEDDWWSQLTDELKTESGQTHVDVDVRDGDWWGNLVSELDAEACSSHGGPTVEDQNSTEPSTGELANTLKKFPRLATPDAELLVALRGVTGVEVKSRTWHLRRYKKCFVAQDAVTYIVARLQIPREDAVRVGRRLEDAGAIEHVTKDHHFQDKTMFFRFLDEEVLPLPGKVATASSVSSSDPPPHFSSEDSETIRSKHHYRSVQDIFSDSGASLTLPAPSRSVGHLNPTTGARIPSENARSLGRHGGFLSDEAQDRAESDASMFTVNTEAATVRGQVDEQSVDASDIQAAIAALSEFSDTDHTETTDTDATRDLFIGADELAVNADPTLPEWLHNRTKDEQIALLLQRVQMLESEQAHLQDPAGQRDQTGVPQGSGSASTSEVASRAHTRTSSSSSALSDCITPPVMSRDSTCERIDAVELPQSRITEAQSDASSSPPLRRFPAKKSSVFDLSALRSSSSHELETEQRLSEAATKTRGHITTELLDTERSYIKCLSLAEFFCRKLRKAGLAGKDAVAIFQSIPELLENHTDLLAALEKGGIDEIGRIFLHDTDFFSQYRAYAVRYPSSLEALAHARRLPAVHDRLSRMAVDSRVNPSLRSLESLLIEPIQRLPRYKLLLKDLLDRTPHDHPDVGNLKVALDRLTATIRAANLDKRNAEELSRLRNMLERKSFASLDLQQRVFVRDGMLMVAKTSVVDGQHAGTGTASSDARGRRVSISVIGGGSRGKKRTRHVILFQNLLLLCKERADSVRRKSGPAADLPGSRGDSAASAVGVVRPHSLVVKVAAPLTRDSRLEKRPDHLWELCWTDKKSYKLLFCAENGEELNSSWAVSLESALLKVATTTRS